MLLHGFETAIYIYIYIYLYMFYMVLLAAARCFPLHIEHAFARLKTRDGTGEGRASDAKASYTFAPSVRGHRKLEAHALLRDLQAHPDRKVQVLWMLSHYP